MLAQILPGFRDFRTPLVTEATSVVISALEIETIKSNVLNGLEKLKGPTILTEESDRVVKSSV